MTKIISLLMILGLGGSAAWYFNPFAAGDSDKDGISNSGIFTVRRGDLKITITENGTLMAKESQKVSYKARWEGKFVSLIEEGTKVKEGDELCRMDTKNLNSRREQVDLDIVQADANLKSAKTEVEIQETENEAASEKAKIALEKATKELERYVDGDAPHARRKLEIAVKDIETEHTRAEKRYNDSKILLEKDFIKKTELEDHKILFEKAQVQLDGAKNELKMFDKYTYPMTLKEKSAAKKDAIRELSAVEKRTVSKMRQKEVMVAQSQKKLKRYNKALKDLNEDLGNMVLKAPCPGIVIYGDPRNSWIRTMIKVGGEIWGGNTVFTIPDLRVMQVKLEIHEADISKLKNGQTAKITMDTYPGLLLSGKVSKIATIANTSRFPGSGTAQVKKFDVVITMDETKEVTLKPGISAKAEIHIDDRPKIIFVPLQAVFIEEGIHYCHVRDTEGRPVRRKLEAGLSNDNYLEVTAGLEEGEEVLLYNPELGTAISPDAEKTDPSLPASETGTPVSGSPSPQQ